MPAPLTQEPHKALSSAIEERKAVFEKLPEVREIINIRERVLGIGFDRITQDELSRCVCSLSVYMVNLGQEVANALYLSNYAYAFRKFQFVRGYKAAREKAQSVKDADAAAQEATAEEVDTEVRYQYVANCLKTFYDDTERFISALQTRRKALQDEVRASKELP